ncbi:S-layer homology domain-containing protein [Cohnella cellulosilytica]|uniref:S-layer homology domain-containing protein n=2 Tax=Cohnella cellulosilytica TaxID=986710 RepID=A0ABW2FCX0_9BACL
MGRKMRKTLNLLLVVALGVGGLLPQVAETRAAAADRAANGAISDNGLRSLLAELTPEAFAEASGTLAAPLLDPLPALTNEESIVVAGSAPTDAEVTVTYSVSYDPNDPVTREELAVLMRRFAGTQGFAPSLSAGDASELDRFADARNVSDWAREAVGLAVRQRWMQGMTETELNPHGQASRAQAASLLLRLLTSLGVIEQ